MTEKKTYRIFISSPSDVNPERLIARRVVERLDREFSYHFRLETLLWEREPLVATEHFQTMILPPSRTDIVIVLLWSRLGSPLPRDQFTGAVSGRQPVTGTEWEFEDALKAYREGGRPDMLLYRKKANISSDLNDETAVMQKLQQKKLVEEFMRRWFVDESDGSFKAASHVFESSAEFEEMLEIHLRSLLGDRLQLPDSEDSRVGIRWHQGSPFRGLESFELEHSEVFFGRLLARNELRELLVQRTRDTAFLLVQGASGSGKSSLVKAGLLPDLLLPGMVERVGLCRYLMMRPGDFAEDLVAGFASRLLSGTALPEITTESWDVTLLSAQLRQTPELAVLPIRKGLEQAGRSACLTEAAEARLVVIIDQFEELFTLPGIGQASRREFVQLLDVLSRSGFVWVIATMRSDFVHRLEELPLLKELTRRGTYQLFPPEDHELGHVIEKPAQMAGLRFEMDKKTGLSLSEEIRATAARQPGSLPLLEFVLEQLWQQRTAEGLLTFEAYHAMGGLQGALGRRAEEIFSGLEEELRNALPEVLRLLVTFGQDQNTQATARVVPLGHFREGGASRRLVDALLSPGARLLVADAGGVRVAHEALFTHWDRARRQIDADRRDLLVRNRLEKAAKLWRETGGKKKGDSLLLPPGIPLMEGRDLLRRWKQELDPMIVEYISKSVRANRRRIARRTLMVLGFMLLIPLVVGVYYGTRICLGVRDIEPELEFVEIPKGCFVMGSPAGEPDHKDDESPQHEVCVGPLKMMKYEVTQRQWEKVMLENPSSFKAGPQYPVETVSHDDIRKYLRWLNLFGRHRYRLPTEAEWEYAARAGSVTSRYWGDEEKDACLYANPMDRQGQGHYGKQIGSHFPCDDGHVFTSPVGRFKPNAFGLHDMLGNVSEWVTDWYDAGYYAKSPRDAPGGPSKGTHKVVRGGSWYYVPARVRSANRINYHPNYRNNGVGFRLVRE